MTVRGRQQAIIINKQSSLLCLIHAEQQNAESVVCIGMLQDIAKRYPEGLPQLDPVQDLNITDPVVIDAAAEMNDLEQRLAKNPGIVRWIHASAAPHDTCVFSIAVMCSRWNSVLLIIDGQQHDYYVPCSYPCR